MKEMPQEDHAIAEQKNKLDPNEWIHEFVLKAESMEPGQTLEITVPEAVNYLDFLVALGLPQRDYEIGGLFNTKNRSMVLLRGSSPDEFMPTNPSVEFIRPRRNEDNSTDDEYFHTHPWDEKSVIQFFRDPQNACSPSDRDTQNVLALSMIEKEVGQDPLVISHISSGGFLSKTEARGVNINSEKLQEIGVTQEQIRAVKADLAIAYPKYLENFAKDEESKKQLCILLDEFYSRKNIDVQIPFTQRLGELQKKIAEFCKVGSRRGVYRNESFRIAEIIGSHFPDYPSATKLSNFGLNDEQITAIHEMIGLTITKYKQTSTGLVQV